jgi:nitric oxide synthase oxygenase domain/subunit
VRWQPEIRFSFAFLLPLVAQADTNKTSFFRVQKASSKEKSGEHPLRLKVSSILVVLYHIPVLKATEKEGRKGL